MRLLNRLPSFFLRFITCGFKYLHIITKSNVQLRKAGIGFCDHFRTLLMQPRKLDLVLGYENR